LSLSPRTLWARTKLHVWPERYTLVSLPVSRLDAAALLVASNRNSFGAVVVERDEVSLTLREELWAGAPLRSEAREERGPYRAITFDLDLDLDVCGYLAPAAERLAAAGISIVPQCAFLKDHILVAEIHLEGAVRVLEDLIRDSLEGGHGEGE
jgi:hypothetical protein